MNSRTGGRQSMSELKLRRLLEHNQRLREDLARPRVKVSEASASLIKYCKSTKDYLVPSVWGTVGRAEDPYGQQTGVASARSNDHQATLTFDSVCWPEFWEPIHLSMFRISC
ncbi:Guanine nucleotide-binding protein subunit gamma [Pleurotus ostreatus]|nr:Guanine nucleotide-binding protein subunit gamma [Pleurotus ostreatus]